MEKIISDFLAQLKLGKAQAYKNMAVIPIFLQQTSGPQYLTLKEAMDMGVLEVTEIGHSGSVPELKATNKGKMPILILDGEEIIGAKQNRVLNTTVLLKEESETVIPVSCTEQGRWNYTSEMFHDSEVIAAHKVRLNKNISVSRSLNFDESFRADQGRIWNDIKEYHFATGVKSSTGAMRDVFEKKKESLDDYINSFKLNPGQNGIIVFLQGKVIGFDYVSLSSAYETLHLKLLKSYAMDAVLENNGKDYSISEERARELIDKINDSDVKIFDSVGYGKDFRFKSKDIIGSSLVWHDNVIHMACFRVDDDGSSGLKDTGNMSGYRRRMGNRSR